MKKIKLAIAAVAVTAIIIVGGKIYFSRQSGIPQIDIVEVNKDEEIEEYKKEYTKLGKQIHFSVDDVFNSLVNITTNEYDSIFEEEHFAFLKQLHDDYGVKISAFVFFENSDYDLTEISGEYIEQFEENADWLSFGFHSLNVDTNYKDATLLKAESDYNKVMTELMRIVGKDSITRTVRLHNYAVSVKL